MTPILNELDRHRLTDGGSGIGGALGDDGSCIGSGGPAAAPLTATCRAAAAGLDSPSTCSTNIPGIPAPPSRLTRRRRAFFTRSAPNYCPHLIATVDFQAARSIRSGSPRPPTCSPDHDAHREIALTLCR